MRGRLGRRAGPDRAVPGSNPASGGELSPEIGLQPG